MSKSKDTDLTATLEFEGVERQPLRNISFGCGLPDPFSQWIWSHKSGRRPFGRWTPSLR